MLVLYLLNKTVLVFASFNIIRYLIGYFGRHTPGFKRHCDHSAFATGRVAAVL